MKTFYSLILLSLGFGLNLFAQEGDNYWLKPTIFHVDSFRSPSLYYAPYTRWWWPGNDVDSLELKREIKLFAENHFGGVEVQPIALVMPTKGKGRAERIMSYDTPNYYANLTAMCQEAIRQGITVDMTNGSGWPSGGAHISEHENNKTIQYGMTDIPFSFSKPIVIPKPMRGDGPSRKLVTLLAMRGNYDGEGIFTVEPNSVKNITTTVNDTTFSYVVKEKGWKAVAVWSLPDMESPMLMASRNAGYAINHFDSTVVKKNYEYFFGNRTGLDRFYGNPLRAVFNDSYEFRADRHFADDFVHMFVEKRGYDITPYLPVNIWYGYNNMYERMAHPEHRPKFRYGSEDWRIRYDYDLTLSDLLCTHFMQTSRKWLEKRGMIHRTQTYGLNMDMIAMAGEASIPEVETMMFGKGTETGFKIISSGAHLYNRPLISSESGVFIRRAFLTTPHKLKLTVDKLLSAGVNHIIWHGSPYKYYPEGYPKEGWYPFFNSALGINFSSDLNEENPFWGNMKDINLYVQRSQYVLRSGRPQADVLIYFPFLHYDESAKNPKEFFSNGYLPKIEPALDKDNATNSYESEEIKKWFSKIWPLINALNERGITWDWVNDASIQTIQLDNKKQIDIRGNKYQALIIHEVPYIQIKSAEVLQSISKEGANLLLIGGLPQMQPSFKDYAENDKKTADMILNASKGKHVTNLAKEESIEEWAAQIHTPLRYKGKHIYMRQIRRELEEGNVVEMMWNADENWNEVKISIGDDYNYAYWLDAKSGNIYEAKIDKEHCVSRLFEPYTAYFLYLTRKAEVEHPKVVPDIKRGELVKVLDKWDVKVDTITLEQVVLTDWRNIDQLKYLGSKGRYTTTFAMNSIEKGTHYLIDLGKVYHVASLTLNGRSLGTCLFMPFIMDVTPYLKKGINKLEIEVTPTKFNEFVKRGIDKDRMFKRLKECGLQAQGLVGPVTIYKRK